MPYRRPYREIRRKPPLGTPLNFSDPLTEGLVAAYLLAEGAGSKTIDSVQQTNGVLSGSGASGWATGRGGKAWSGNGSSRYIDIGLTAKPAALNLTGTFTILSLINLAALGATQCIALDRNTAQTLSQWGLFVNNTNQLVGFWVATGYGNGTALVANKWYSVGTQRTGTTGAWNCINYVNGLLDYNFGSITANPSAQQGAAIGADGNHVGLTLNGLIEYVYIWNRALTAGEILQVHLDPYRMYAPSRRRFSSFTATGTTGTTGGISPMFSQAVLTPMFANNQSLYLPNCPL